MSHSTTKVNVLTIATGMLLGTAAAVQAQTTWYVNDDGDPGNGCTSWADACPDLQTALSLTTAGDEIWVAAGTYAPAPPAGDRAATFQLKIGVGIYGGFAGGEVNLEDRDPVANVTILTGDLTGDDVPVADAADLLTEPTRGENSYHVVTASETDKTAILDGFTIAGGNANENSWPHDQGGGLISGLQGSPTVENCTFTANSAEWAGGGMANHNDSSPTLTNCAFSGNAARTGGGGMTNWNGSSPTLMTCTFTDNVAIDWDGGALSNGLASEPTLTACTFSNNTAGGPGGAVANSDSNPTMTDCLFNGNSAGLSGGAMSNWQSSPWLFGCTFDANSAGDGGGGMHNNASNPILSGGTFTANVARWGGGMDNCCGSIPELTECAFSENTAESGGGMHNWESHPMLMDCPFTANIASFVDKDGVNQGRGGGMNNESSNPVVTGCIFTTNTSEVDGGGMRNANDSSPTVTDCTFSGNESGAGAGMFNWAGSNPTVVGCTFDANMATFSGGGMDNRNLSSPTVTDCTFTSNSAVNSGGGMRNNDSSPNVTSCTFSGNTADSSGGGMRNENSSSPDVTDCAFSGNSADFGGGILNNNSSPNVTSCTFSGNTTDFSGGGMRNENSSSPDVTDCTFSENSATVGGGMHNSNSTPVVTACTFSGNTANFGAGMNNIANSIPTVIDCEFSGNAAANTGGGMNNFNNSSPIVTNCTFSGNTAENDGGGMRNHVNSSPIVTNCEFNGNTAVNNGGGMLNNDSSPIVTECQFSMNSADSVNSSGGGMRNENGSSPIVTVCTFSENSADFGGGMTNANSSPTLTNCLFSGNSADFGGGMRNNNGSPVINNCEFLVNTAIRGGGIDSVGTSSSQLTDCTFTGNVGTDFGGGMAVSGSNPTLANCVFNGNSADKGGGLYTRLGNPLLTNCTFVANLSPSGLALASSFEPSVVRVTNSILWDGGDEISNVNGSTFIITYSDVEGGWPGEGNIDDDPLFADADLHISCDSPCVNSGSNFAPALPAEDFEGEPRIASCRVDMGVDESPCTPGFFEDCNDNGQDDACDIHDGPSSDCDHNHVPDECESDGDCNGNGLQDICDLADGAGVTIFATGLRSPEEIVVSQGDYPPGFLVPSVLEDVVYHVSPLGDSVSIFAEGIASPVSATFAPDEFGQQGDRLFVISRTDPPRIVFVDSEGNVVDPPFAVLPLAEGGEGIGVAYVPLAVGGPAAGKLVVTGEDSETGGKVFLVDENGESTSMIDIPAPPWTPTLAPEDFGDFGHHIFLGESGGPILFAIDPQTFEVKIFADVPFNEHLRALRHITFSPPGWAASLDPALEGESVLLLSVASSVFSNEAFDMGAIMVWDQRGNLVAELRKEADGLSIEPRGLRFDGDDLLISDLNDGRRVLLKVTVDSFALLDCNANGVPDECEINQSSTAPGGPFFCDPADPPAPLTECDPDCNDNGIPDECDVNNETSEDCNGNSIPDECIELEADCNSNGIPDQCEFDDEQWASTVIDFSSQFSSTSWSAQQALGEPDTFQYGDLPTAWAPLSQNGTLEFLTLGYSNDVFSNGVVIRETYGNGFVYQVDVLDVEDQLHTVWTGADPSQPGTPVDFLVSFPPTDFLVKGVKIYIDTDHDLGAWEEIDAVQLLRAPGTDNDCNDNGVLDECDIADCMGEPACSDCNGNGVPDECDIESGESGDCNNNGIPDECELPESCPQGICTDGCDADCNDNCVIDSCDVDPNDPDGNGEVSDDCNGNGIPDVCDLDPTDPDGDGEVSIDCNNNGIPDECEIADCPPDTTFCDDCNLNGVLDGCDVDPSDPDGDGQVSDDADGDGIPDECVEAQQDGDWSGDIWDLEGKNPYPDNEDGVPDQSVTLDAQEVFLDVSVEVPSLRLINGASLPVAQVGQQGDLTIFDPNGVFDGNLLVEGDLTIGDGRSIDAEGEVTIGPGGIYHAEDPNDPPLDATLEAGSITMQGGGTVNMSGSMELISQGEVTIGPGGVYQADPAAEGPISAALEAGSITVRGGTPDEVGGIIDLTGSMELTSNGDMRMQSNQADDDKDGCKGSGTPPDFNSADSAKVRVMGTLSIGQCAEVNITSSEPVIVDGDMQNQSTMPIGFDWDVGGLLMNGTSQTIEAAGEDRGPCPFGFNENFVIGTLTLAENAVVQVIDDFDNQKDGTTACDEALYVGVLILEAGSELQTNGCRVYYEELINDGFIPGFGTDVLQVESTCADIDGNGVVDAFDLAFLLGSWGPCPPEDDCPADQNGDGVVDAFDLAVLLGSWGPVP